MMDALHFQSKGPFLPRLTFHEVFPWTWENSETYPKYTKAKFKVSQNVCKSNKGRFPTGMAVIAPTIFKEFVLLASYISFTARCTLNPLKMSISPGSILLTHLLKDLVVLQSGICNHEKFQKHPRRVFYGVSSLMPSGTQYSFLGRIRQSVQDCFQPLNFAKENMSIHF